MSYNIIHFRSNKAVDLTLVSENFRYVACRRRNRLSLALKQRIDTFRTKQNKDIVHSKLLGWTLVTTRLDHINLYKAIPSPSRTRRWWSVSTKFNYFILFWKWCSHCIKTDALKWRNTKDVIIRVKVFFFHSNTINDFGVKIYLLLVISIAT